jgi:DNA-binding transcriptional regulator YhcF (GntR family)
MVTYMATADDYLRNIAVHLSTYRDGILDMRQMNPLLLCPLLEAGIKQWDEATWEKQWSENKNIDFDGMSLSIRLYTAALSSLYNDLILTFYRKINFHARIPYLRSEHVIMKGIIETVDTLTKDEVGAYLTNKLGTVYIDAFAYILKIIQTLSPQFLEGEFTQIPFEWDFYPRHSQIRYTLGAKIILEILYGAYPVGSFLPSLSQLVKRYQIPLITIRRTLASLSDFGVVKSYQGRGTQVCLGHENVDISRVSVQFGLKRLLESLQFLSLTVSNVSRFTFEQVSEEALYEFLQTLNQIYKEKKDYLIVDVFLTFITKHCPCTIVCECYCKLAECLATGYPFILLKMKGDNYKRLYSTRILQTIQCAECMDREGILVGWSEFFEEQRLWYRAFLLKKGVDTRMP